MNEDINIPIMNSAVLRELRNTLAARSRALTSEINEIHEIIKVIEWRDSQLLNNQDKLNVK